MLLVCAINGCRMVGGVGGVGSGNQDSNLKYRNKNKGFNPIINH